MADTTTPNYGLTKPEIGASTDSWGNKLNNNFNILDLLAIKSTDQWKLVLGDNNPTSTSGSFIIERYNNSIVKQTPDPLNINRQTGLVTIASGLFVNGNATVTGLTAGSSGISVGSSGNLTVASPGAITGTLVGSVVGGVSNTVEALTVTTTNMNTTNFAVTNAFSAPSFTATGAVSGQTLSATGNITSSGGTVSGVTLTAGTGGIGTSGTISSTGSITSNNGNLNATAGTITGHTINATTGGLNSSTTLIVAGTSTFNGSLIANATTNINGALNVSSSSSITFNPGSTTLIYSTASFGPAGQPPFTIRGDAPHLGFLWNGVFLNTLGIHDDGNFYMGGGSFGSGITYQFWTKRDFTAIPVTAARLGTSSDVARAKFAPMYEHGTGYVMTGVAYGGDAASTFRFRPLQVFTTDWFTVS